MNNYYTPNPQDNEPKDKVTPVLVCIIILLGVVEFIVHLFKLNQ